MNIALCIFYWINKHFRFRFQYLSGRPAPWSVTTGNLTRHKVNRLWKVERGLARAPHVHCCQIPAITVGWVYHRHITNKLFFSPSNRGRLLATELQMEVVAKSKGIKDITSVCAAAGCTNTCRSISLKNNIQHGVYLSHSMKVSWC